MIKLFYFLAIFKEIESQITISRFLIGDAGKGLKVVDAV